MEWFNAFGLVFLVAIMIPNIIFALKQSDAFENKYRNKAAIIIEQIGRYGCIGFMIFNIPTTEPLWWPGEMLIAYLIVDTILVLIYWLIWILCRNKNNTFRALSLSIIPSVLFLFSGIMCRSLPLIISSLIFMPSHILISYKNACKEFNITDIS